ncbi:MAG: hypothetical protein CVT72_10810 [Alphaproteobacteria bacterium HGW-Alphaproteobacteria-11]|nr:MAG: hypothetical protein CVT72_10810 [Alphaproteobacteria bacterium HGW-Alphaproteobacteria-11]
MPRLTGPRLLALALALLYAGFWVWYGGTGKPLSPNEVDRFMARIDAMATDHQSPFGARETIEAWARADDGREFFMINLVNDPADLAAAEAYNRVILPELFKRAGHPIFMSRSIARFIEPAGLAPWDFVAIVRYRSMRDMLDMITGPEAENIRHLKEGSVSKTHVFPTHIGFSLLWVRFLVALVFAALGVGLHFSLRPFVWYAR